MAFGGLFDMFGGGGSSFSGGGIGSSQSAQQTDTKDFSRIDNRVLESGAVTGGDLTISTGDVTAPQEFRITQTDQGAIKAGIDVALAGIDVVDIANSRAVGAIQSVASDSINQAYGLANEARQSETSGAINNFVKYAFWLAVAGVLTYGVIKTK